MAEIVQSKGINREKNQNPSGPHFRAKLTFLEEVYRYTWSKQLQKDILSFFQKKKIFKPQISKKCDRTFHDIFEARYRMIKIDQPIVYHYS